MFRLPNFEFDEGYAGGQITDEEQVSEIVDTINAVAEAVAGGEDTSTTIVTPEKNYSGTSTGEEGACEFNTTDGSMTVAIFYEINAETGNITVIYSAELYQ